MFVESHPYTMQQLEEHQLTEKNFDLVLIDSDEANIRGIDRIFGDVCIGKGLKKPEKVFISCDGLVYFAVFKKDNPKDSTPEKMSNSADKIV